MEDIFDLSVSKKESEFVENGLKLELDVTADIIETFKNIPYIGSLIKLGWIGFKGYELFYIKKLARFLEKENEIPEKEKEEFLNGLGPKQRKKIHEYLTHYLLHAEDVEKADIMGYIYIERIRKNIDNKMFLRLCSIIDKVFLFDLRVLPKYIEKSTEDSIEANNFINLGLIDNFVGGAWIDEPSYMLNDVGKTLHRILKQNGWFEKE